MKKVLFLVLFAAFFGGVSRNSCAQVLEGNPYHSRSRPRRPMIFVPQVFRAWTTGWFRRRSPEFEAHCRFEPDARLERRAGNGSFRTSKKGDRVPLVASISPHPYEPFA